MLASLGRWPAVTAFLLLLGGLLSSPAMAQVAEKTVNKGDVAWMFTATIIVLLMTIPGLALFYGGLVRSKNMLSVLMQVFYTVCIVCILWVVYGYSLAFTEGGGLNAFIGGLSRVFLRGVDAKSQAETFTLNVMLPEYTWIAFQMTFAAITSALVVGAIAERTRFAAVALFVPLWMTFVYLPMAHMVWYSAGPEAAAVAAKAIADAGTNATAKAAAEAAAAAVSANAGLMFQWGALDFAGGTVVHINSGIAGLVGAIIVGKRVGYGRESMPPHSLTMTMIGGALLWVGWFGFNAGSALEANEIAALAVINTFVATAAAALAWLIIENMTKGKPSLLGAVTGAVAGLVAVTPAAGIVGPMGAICLGFVAGIVCFIFCTSVKKALGYDDALDVFGVHGIGGIVGAIGTGIFAAPFLGGQGAEDFNIASQVIVQAKGVLVTILWSGIGSAIIFKLVDILVGLRLVVDQEREGLDIVDHGERAYS